MSTSESNKPCIVVEERGTADSYTRTTASTPSRISVPVSPSQRVCFLSPTEVSFYKKIELGKILSRHLASHESWNLLFLHSDAAFVRFNFSVPHSARMALLARRNEPPSITAYDIMEVIADHHRLYRRTTAMKPTVPPHSPILFACLIFCDFIDTLPALYLQPSCGQMTRTTHERDMPPLKKFHVTLEEDDCLVNRSTTLSPHRMIFGRSFRNEEPSTFPDNRDQERHQDDTT
ncbi:hypothetical protein AVEN_179302-1 [Araneus ventricosus]|uniref:Teneurin-1-4-like galactose-binding domain-containing protein n=1 Tax=Araneus ventricosus TaxID=182803 RepID=A0A4Y2W5F1_ARAVE|nr:hypothetical protein AVEN_179302-1 [Araneus ventricosus]